MSMCDMNVCVGYHGERVMDVWSVCGISVFVGHVSVWYACMFMFMSVFVQEYEFVEWWRVCVRARSFINSFFRSTRILELRSNHLFPKHRGYFPPAPARLSALRRLGGTLEFSFSLIMSTELLLRIPTDGTLYPSWSCCFTENFFHWDSLPWGRCGVLLLFKFLVKMSAHKE